MRWNRLGRCAQTISGVGFPPGDQGKAVGDIPFLKVSDLALAENRSGLKTAVNWISTDTAGRLGVRFVPVGATVFPKVGAALLGNARGLTKRVCAIDNNMMAVVPRAGDPRYWFYYLSSLDLGALDSGGTLPFVSDSAVRDLRVPEPTLAVQRRIADFLDDQVARIDQLVGLRAKQAALVGELFQARIDDLYRAESNPPLRSLLAQDPCYGVLVPEFTEAADGVPLIRINNLLRPSAEVDRMPRIAARQSWEYRRTVVRPGDVLLSVVGSLDKAAIVPPEWSGANVNRPVARLVPRKGIPPEVIYGWTMTSAYMRDAMLATGAGTAQATLNMGDLRRFRVPVPQDVLALAGRVRALLDWRRAAVAGVETSTSLLQERKRSLITAAVTGGFDITTGSSRHTA